MMTWLQLLQGITKTVDSQTDDLNMELKETIYGLTPQTLSTLVEEILPQLADTKNEDLGSPGVMNPQEIVEYIQSKAC